MVVINLLFLIGITYLWFNEGGPAAAGFIGLTLMMTVGSTLPWYVVLPMMFWLSSIIRNWRRVEADPKDVD